MLHLPVMGGDTPAHDARLAAPIAGVYVCGDAAGVESGAVSLESGRLAGLAAAAYLGSPHPDSARLTSLARGRLAYLRRGRRGLVRREAKAALARAARRWRHPHPKPCEGQGTGFTPIPVSSTGQALTFPLDGGRDSAAMRTRAGLKPAPTIAIRRGGQWASGSSSTNVAPSPAALSARIEPPCASTSFLAMVNPSPAPPVARLREGSTR